MLCNSQGVTVGVIHCLHINEAVTTICTCLGLAADHPSTPSSAND